MSLWVHQSIILTCQHIAPAVETVAAVVRVGSGNRTVGRSSRTAVESSRSPEADPPGLNFLRFSRLPLRIISSSRRPSTAKHKVQCNYPKCILHITFQVLIGKKKTTKCLKNTTVLKSPAVHMFKGKKFLRTGIQCNLSSDWEQNPEGVKKKNPKDKDTSGRNSQTAILPA